MLWQIPAIISVITLSLATLIARVMMKKEDSNPFGSAIIFQFILGIIALFIALIFGRFIVPPLTQMPWRFLFSSLLWAGSTLSNFKAIKKLPAGEVVILTSSGSLISIALGIIILNEPLKIPVVVGTVLILSAIWIITSEKLSFSSREGVFFAFASAFCAGVAVVNDAIILKSYEAFSYTAVMSFLPAIPLLFIFPKHFVKLTRQLNMRYIFSMVVFCTFYAVQAITFYFAFENGAPVSQLSPIMRSSVILTIILAALFLKERSHLYRKLLAALVMITGVILLR